MAIPEISKYKPYFFEVKKGKRYLWCACGRSKKQPLCDGSHRDTEFMPVRYDADSDKDVLFCGCKHTGTAPFCDGAHNNLLDEYPSDDPNSPENRAIPNIARTVGKATMLDGGCFVVNPSAMPTTDAGNFQYVEFLSQSTGAKYQSQNYAVVKDGSSPVISYGGSYVVGFVLQGDGELLISGRKFNVQKRTGFVVHPHETFQFVQHGDTPLEMYLNVCPIESQPDFSCDMRDNFNFEFPQRVAVVDRENADSMADRFFQVLIDKRLGCSAAAQFIGDIPESKAEPHRHLYEESIIVVAGQGTMWTDKRKTDVAAGDVIFLPQKQVHSLQCTDPDGMLVLGVIYPGDNPSINY